MDNIGEAEDADKVDKGLGPGAPPERRGVRIQLKPYSRRAY